MPGQCGRWHDSPPVPVWLGAANAPPPAPPARCSRFLHTVFTFAAYAVHQLAGVEDAPGRKNHDRMRAFVEAVRREDARVADR